ncbi:hypothetical protein JR316_0004572 [Psilocybe cubensis]|uniref:BTB domain-containing protein n=2 Tax=Psilocybe cubensis TaxID=181762 RepID=A0A8H7Y0M6_PSICU|nr:hypothetical protein JR316_0004572 [Psilocybe cubensis]KAH9482472.1 hypothetical protein JR316_0004572 [Psilocybe cubensis]
MVPGEDIQYQDWEFMVTTPPSSSGSHWTASDSPSFAVTSPNLTFDSTAPMADNIAPNEPTNVKIVENWWSENTGFVILEAEGRLFKMLATLFLRKSPVFKAAYDGSPTSPPVFCKKIYVGSGSEIIQKTQGKDIIVFEMLDVTAKEAEEFVHALLDPEHFDRPPKKEKFEVILAIFKLASLYEVNYLRRNALAHLELAYPCTNIEDWDSREQRSTFSVDRSAEFYQTIPHTLTNTFSLIELCMAHRAFWILPAAFYECCLYNVDKILEHPKWAECNDDSLLPAIKNKIITGFISQKEETSRVLSFLHVSLPQCNSSRKCNEIRQGELANIYITRGNKRRDMDFLGTVWDKGDWDEFGEQGMCGQCLSMCRSYHNNFRVDAWENLPSLYDLPDWDSLRELRSHVMKY